MHKILLFNPRSAQGKHRLPNSILQIGASVMNKYEVVFVDGNMEEDPWTKISFYLQSGDFICFGCSVMPGPQLKEAIPFCKQIRDQFPFVKIVWGGYFPSNQYKAVLKSKFVDVVIHGMGDVAFPKLMDAFKSGEKSLVHIENLIYKQNDEIITTVKQGIIHPDDLPSLPYNAFNAFYPIKNYLGKTFLGNRTISYHSSFGCPFTCSFCGVVPIYNGKWKGKSAEKLYKDIYWLKENYGIDSIEFFDNNFFASKKRVVEFSKLVLNDKLSWWGEGRIDTVSQYSDEDLSIMAQAGCKMIFFGAETGNDDVLLQMNKGGGQTALEVKRLAARLKLFNIIPEYSFVLGMPGLNENKIMAQIKSDIRFIKEIKAINEHTEIIIYLYSPVPVEGSELYDQITKAGFKFPENMEDWLNPDWENFDLRKNPLTPWLTSGMVNKIKDFETVLNGLYPTVSDYRVRGGKKWLLKAISWWRYKTGFYYKPYEIKAFHKLWKYRQPEIEGFYAE